MMKKARAMRPAKRDPRKEAFWRRVIHGQPRCGLSIRAWCAHRQVRESSFFWWRRELARREAVRAALSPVRITPDSSMDEAADGSPGNGSRGSIEILWPNQRRVRVVGPVDRQALADVLAVMTLTISIEPAAATFRAPEAW
jgi:hypothetical protein